MDLVLMARTPIIELVEAGGSKAVEEKVLEVIRKASLLCLGEERRSSQ
jgi:hypothetical protein